MHEVFIVQSILDAVTAEVEKVSAEKVEEIHLEIGLLAGVEMDALLIAWDACIPGTILEKARRNIYRVRPVAICDICENEFKPATLVDPCPCCGSFKTSLITGEELKIRSLVVS